MGQWLRVNVGSAWPRARRSGRVCSPRGGRSCTSTGVPARGRRRVRRGRGPQRGWLQAAGLQRLVAGREPGRSQPLHRGHFRRQRLPGRPGCGGVAAVLDLRAVLPGHRSQVRRRQCLTALEDVFPGASIGSAAGGPPRLAGLHGGGAHDETDAFAFANPAVHRAGRRQAWTSRSVMDPCCRFMAQRPRPSGSREAVGSCARARGKSAANPRTPDMNPAGCTLRRGIPGQHGTGALGTTVGKLDFGGVLETPEALLDVLHLLREIGREGAWMLDFRDRALGRVHVWVHRNWGLEPVSAPNNRLCHGPYAGVLQAELAHHDVAEGSDATPGASLLGEACIRSFT